MKFKKADDWKVNGTHLQGHVNASYDELVAVFGKEHSDGDGYKVQAEWVLKFEDGTIATIYDYKEGKNYNGSSGISKEKVTDWHIGGTSFGDALDRARQAIRDYDPNVIEMESPRLKIGN